MSLTLMYITNDPAIARIAAKAGVQRIFIDMEYIGKADRQGGMDTVQSHHTIEDICRIRAALDQLNKEGTHADLLVRVNPIHDAGSYLGLPHVSSEEEITAAIAAGADIVMLPYFKTKAEVDRFVRIVRDAEEKQEEQEKQENQIAAGNSRKVENRKVKTMLLLETDAAVKNLDEILTVPGIDYIHIGINDLSLDQGKVFMFQQLADGTAEDICEKIRKAGIPYGIGGIASPGKGMLPAEYIIRDHYRLGSTCAILSRAFCNTSQITDLAEIESIFEKGMADIHAIEAEVEGYTPEEFAANHAELQRRVEMVTEAILAKRRTANKQ